MQKFLLFCLLLLAACTSAPAATQITDAPLQPYLTGTPASTATPHVLVMIDTPIPTNTPQMYSIESGDTISEIAEKFKISQSDLLAANPDANPNALVIGQTLVIPDPSAQPAAAATLTPMPVPVAQAACHPTTDSGLWCFALIQNNTSDYLENISAQVTLFDENTNPVTSQVGYLPLDVVAPNSSLPVSVYFPNIAGSLSPQIQVLSAMPGSGTSLLPALLNNTVTLIDWEGKSARVSGVVSLPAESTAATRVWIAAVAYDKHGTVVGVKRWAGEGLQPGGSLRFEFVVPSLGGVIEAVQLALEVR